jgi:hypothetical protein
MHQIKISPNRFRVFENRMLRRILRPKAEEVTGRREKFAELNA